jgi:CubicO group peptidase (beta-lactamase class C family)
VQRSSVQSLIFLLTSSLIAWLPDASGQSAATRIESQSRFPGDTWQQSGPLESAGWSQEKLAAARRYAEADSIRSSAVMIVQGGAVIAEWGDIDKKISSYSVRKSLLSALFGIYAAQGVIDIDRTLEQLGIDDSPDPLTKGERQARVIDLLRARSGVYHAVDFETATMKKNRPARGSHPPGTFWYYNNWDFNVLGTIFEKQTGLKCASSSKRFGLGASFN